VVLPYQGYARHLAWLQHGAQIGGAKLWYDRSKHRFYLLVSLTIDTPDPTPATLSEVVGVDLGQRNLATLTTPENHTRFYSWRAGESQSRPLCASAETAGAAKALTRPPGDGSPSARQTIRFKLSTNHTIARQILDTHPKSLIGLEDLTGIRERTKRRKRRVPGPRNFFRFPPKP
jgi:hypothetical protein